MKKLVFLILTIVISLNSLALTKEEFLWCTEWNDIWKGYCFSRGKVNPYTYTYSDMDNYYVLFKDGSGKFSTGYRRYDNIDHNGIRAQYSWHEDIDIYWAFEGGETLAIVGLGIIRYKIEKVEIELLTTHTDSQYQTIRAIVQQKLDKVKEEYMQKVGVTLVYEVIEQLDYHDRHYIVLTPAKTLPFNNDDYHSGVSKSYNELIQEREHKAGTKYHL